MKYATFFAGLCLSMAVIGTVSAADANNMKDRRAMCERYSHYTLEQARENTKKLMDQLNTMSQKEWDLKQQARIEHCVNWKPQGASTPVTSTDKK